MGSRRLPGKPLMLIRGRPMISWVYERAHTSPLLDRLTVATDSDAVLAFCAQEGIPAVQTSDKHGSGTSRLIEVMDQDRERGEAAQIYVNIQGDEPMVTPGHIELLLRPFLCPEPASQCDSHPRLLNGRLHHADAESAPIQVSTLKVAISSSAAADPNAVKVVTDRRDRALYFSRAPIPYDRDAPGKAHYWKHLGFYAYAAQALQRFRSLPPSALEQTEQLEQLRFLEDGVPITVIETRQDTIGVDTEDDLRSVEEYFRQAGIE